MFIHAFARKARLVLAAFLLGALAACETMPSAITPIDAEPPSKKETGREVRNGAANGQIVLLVGVDGLRADAIDRFPDAAPNMRALAERGVRGAMTPAMPSNTFVNFYSIATGLYSGRTGIVSNSAYSRSLGRVMARSEHGRSEWWGGEPIWVTAEKQGVNTATMFWLGSEAEIAGERPSRWRPYDHGKPFAERTAEVLSWLALPEADRPRFASIYFHAVDSAAHEFGVGSPEEREAIASIDKEIGALVEGVAKLGLAERTNIMVVADHGMTAVDTVARIVHLDEFLSFDDVLIPEFEGLDGAGREALVHVFAEKADAASIERALAAAPAPTHFRAWRRENLPAEWRLDNADRTGDVVIVADEGWLLFGKNLTPRYKEHLRGHHGYDRALPSMQAAFIADGPRFADGFHAKAFDNVEVYGMIADVLGIVPAETDGDISRVAYFMTPSQ